jgi:hypothetical protein
MNDPEIYKNYLRDLIYLLKDKLKIQKADTDFESGIKMELENTLDLIKSQADAFQLDLNEVGFYDFEKYQDKLGQSNIP